MYPNILFITNDITYIVLQNIDTNTKVKYSILQNHQIQPGFYVDSIKVNQELFITMLTMNKIDGQFKYQKQLPIELIYSIIDYLDLKDLLNMRMTLYNLNQYCLDQYLNIKVFDYKKLPKTINDNILYSNIKTTDIKFIKINRFNSDYNQHYYKNRTKIYPNAKLLSLNGKPYNREPEMNNDHFSDDYSDEEYINFLMKKGYY